ncbi:MAG: hypothetical protein R6V67_03235, partial [Spirochaetia bacterium]
GEEDSRLTFGISSKETETILQDSTISVQGGFGSVALSLQGGAAEIVDSEMHKGVSSNFSYLIRGDSTSLTLKKVLLTSKESSDSVGIELKGSEANIDSAVLVLFAGEEQARGILLESDSSIDLDKSIVAFPLGSDIEPAKAGNTVAVYEDSSSRVRLRDNTFVGADIILHTAEGEERTNIEELEKARPPYDQKNPHSGNEEEEIEGFFTDPEAGDFTPAR